MDAKRIFDLALAVPGLAIAAPFLILIAIAVRIDTRGPAIFKQIRVGMNGQHFSILKFRTMVQDADKVGSQITAGRDTRITRLGNLLRRFKIDELPQLVNVVRGEMSLVGPRPEVPLYVGFYPDEVRREVLSVRPGMTDLASLEYYDEAALLRSAEDHTSVYINKILPEKLKWQQRYVRERSLGLDIQIIARTIWRVLGL
jgi:lipopolysaccharide/colanic/teichoic acid biosynthesis glycosyltransferase